MCAMDGDSDRANSSLVTLLDIKEHAYSMYPAPLWSGSGSRSGEGGVVRIYFQLVQPWATRIMIIYKVFSSRDHNDA